MKFPFLFTRRKGGSGAVPLLGSDAAAVTANTPPSATQDNAFFSRGVGEVGWPIHRIAVTYACSATSVDLTAQMYAFEKATGAYYKIGAQVTMKQGSVNFFDCLPILELSSASQNKLADSPGSIEHVLVVDDVGAGAVNGTYTFAMAPVLTTQA